jgi:pantoate--beta-alanine ligase
MEIINRRQRMSSITRKLRRDAKVVGLVPTMGALHDGHIALVKEARQRCDIVIVSIFVNPKQFNDKTDLSKYPRDLTADAAMLAEYEVDYIYAPEESEVYPDGFATYVEVEGLTEILEGASRPGHFRGVTTVVTILFNSVRPDLAFFGQKDAQQVAVIKRMTRDLGFETEIIVVPTVRSETGMALSSRNQLLSDEDRASASVLIDALRQAKVEFKKGERNAAALTGIVQDHIRTADDARIDYAEVVDRETLGTLEKVGEDEALIVAAVVIGGVRLIDNVILNRKQ